MLPFKNRLTRKKDFENVQKRGDFFSEGNVAIKLLPNGLDETRVGFVAGLKFSKKAVARNVIKRQLREIFQKKIKAIKKGQDIVVMARKKEEERIALNKVAENIEVVLKKSNLLEK